MQPSMPPPLPWEGIIQPPIVGEWLQARYTLQHQCWYLDTTGWFDQTTGGYETWEAVATPPAIASRWIRVLAEIGVIRAVGNRATKTATTEPHMFRWSPGHIGRLCSVKHSTVSRDIPTPTCYRSLRGCIPHHSYIAIAKCST